ncbi:hypothetical protein BDR22DRAFT_820906 [Usnea florida]
MSTRRKTEAFILFARTIERLVKSYCFHLLARTTARVEHKAEGFMTGPSATTKLAKHKPLTDTTKFVMLALIRTQIFIFFAISTLATPLQLERLDPILQLVPLNFSNLQTIDSSSLNEGPCFSPRPARFPAASDDCYAALGELIAGHRGRTSYIFGRGDGVTYKLPKNFDSGSCTLNLDMVYDDQTATLTVSEVADTASDLIELCTTGIVFKYGGSIAVRPSNVLYVTIIGVAVPNTS